MTNTNRPVMTFDVARAIGRDAANARMAKAGRTAWNQADYNLAARIFTRLSRPLHGEPTPSVPPSIHELLARKEAALRARVTR